MSKVTTAILSRMKANAQKIVMVTAYDYPNAKLSDQAGVDLILVGDSLGMTVLGYPNTLTVTMDVMLHHTKAVARGVKNAMVIGDMPFMSYQVSPETALINAGRFIQEAGAAAVKLEGGAEVAATAAKISQAGIPVLGHLGFTPQAIHRFGGAFFQGKTSRQASQLLEDALRLEDAGVFGMVLELVPWEVAELLTGRLTVPTIGIGAGPACDGQVLVYHDLLGMNPEFQPKHSKCYAQIGSVIREAITTYAAEVREGRFPEEIHTRRMDSQELQWFCEAVKDTGRGGNDRGCDSKDC